MLTEQQWLLAAFEATLGRVQVATTEMLLYGDGSVDSRTNKTTKEKLTSAMWDLYVALEEVRLNLQLPVCEVADWHNRKIRFDRGLEVSRMCEQTHPKVTI